MNPEQMTNDQIIADIQNVFDSVSDATDGKFQYDTILMPYNPDEWIEVISETEFNEDGSPVIYLEPSANAPDLSRMEGRKTSVGEFLLSKSGLIKKHPSHLYKPVEFKLKRKHRIRKKLKSVKARRKWGKRK